MMHLAGEAVGWKLFARGVSVQKCFVNFFGRGAQHAVKANGVGHETSLMGRAQRLSLQDCLRHEFRFWRARRTPHFPELGKFD
jgi:hypothetical protein